MADTTSSSLCRTDPDPEKTAMRVMGGSGTAGAPPGGASMCTMRVMRAATTILLVVLFTFVVAWKSAMQAHALDRADADVGVEEVGWEHDISEVKPYWQQQLDRLVIYAFVEHPDEFVAILALVLVPSFLLLIFTTYTFLQSMPEDDSQRRHSSSGKRRLKSASSSSSSSSSRRSRSRTRRSTTNSEARVVAAAAKAIARAKESKQAQEQERVSHDDSSSDDAFAGDMAAFIADASSKQAYPSNANASAQVRRRAGATSAAQ